jgi:hypothetical protein
VTETIAVPAPGIFGFTEDEAEELGWQERALCAQTDPEAFFPEKGGSTREAKRSAAAARSAPSAWGTPSSTMSGSVSGEACPNANAAG